MWNLTGSALMEYEYKLQVVKKIQNTQTLFQKNQACKHCGPVNRTGLCKVVTSFLTPENMGPLKTALNETKLI